jgi:hypothetical protein
MRGRREFTERRPGPRDDPLAVAERKSRAVEEPLDLKLTAREPYVRVEVLNPLHHSVYQVLLPTYPDPEVALCDCSDFARRGLGTCKHIEAARRWLDRHPHAPVTGPATPPWDGAAAWAEIDRRLSLAPPPGVPESLAWRRPGAVLFEPGGPPTEKREKKEEVRRGDARGSRSTSRERP